jgi:glutathione S-transferase
MPKAVLTISSRNYGAWALRGWLMAKLAKLDFTEHVVPPDDPAMKAEMLLLAPSMLVPCLRHGGITVWDTLAIGEYLHEIKPKAGLLPAERAARAHCRAICGEMHSGFTSLRSALPMNLKAQFPGYKVWSRAATDIERVLRSGTTASPPMAAPTSSAAAQHGRRDVRPGGDPLPDL